MRLRGHVGEASAFKFLPNSEDARKVHGRTLSIITADGSSLGLDSERFRRLPKTSATFRTLRKCSARFRKIPKDSEVFRIVRNERKITRSQCAKSRACLKRPAWLERNAAS